MNIEHNITSPATVVLTACRRVDLLERTLDSFFINGRGKALSLPARRAGWAEAWRWSWLRRGECIRERQVRRPERVSQRCWPAGELAGLSEENAPVAQAGCQNGTASHIIHALFHSLLSSLTSLAGTDFKENSRCPKDSSPP
jgi:hypothetical protein